MRDRQEMVKDSLWSIRYIIVMGLITRILLGFKADLIDSKFGLSGDITGYNIVFVEITLLAGFIAEGISDGLLRLYRKVEEREGRGRVLDYINNLINLLILGLGIALFILGIFLALRGVDRLGLIIMGLPIILLRGITAVLGSFLQMKHGFLAGSRGGVSRSMIYLGYLLLIGDRFGVEGLMLIGVLATFSQFYIAWKVTRSNDYVYRFKLDLKDDHIVKTFKNIVLIIMAVIFYDFSLTSRHSNSFMRYFNGLVISAVITVVYPILAEMSERKMVGKDRTYENFNNVFNEIFIFLSSLILPLLIIAFILSDEIKEIFLNGMAPSMNLLVYYGLGLISLILLPLLFKTLISLEKYGHLTLVTLGSLVIARGLAGLSNGIVGEISADIGLFIGLLTCLYLVNKETKFLDSDYLGESSKNLFKAGLLMLGTIYLMRLSYRMLFQGIIANEFIGFSLMGLAGIYVYLRSIYQKI